MQKVLLAVGFRQLEDYLQKKLKKEFLFVGVTTYRERVIRAIGQSTPDIIVIRETLHGNENILDIVYEIRAKFDNVRIVFLAGKREPGDALLATLVNYGVYDILYGEKIPSDEIIRLLRNPTEYKDVRHLQPKPVLDERKNKVLFESPDVHTVQKEVIKEVVREVYIDNGKEEEVHEHSIMSQSEVDSAPVTPLKDESKVVIEKVVVIKETAPTKSIENPIIRKPEDPRDKSGGILNKWFGAKGEASQSQDQLINGGKQKILTFMGSKSGVGNTSLALNTAVQLAQKKNHVIYIELNERTPAVNYWFELGMLDDGIDSALKGLKESNFEKIKKAIVCSATLMEKDTTLQNNYKKFPEYLDFMFFSNRYLTRRKDDHDVIDLSFTKELYFYLLFQMEYDYIVLDVSPDLENEATIHALQYSNKTIITISQDVSAIGNAVYMLNELNKYGIQVTKKMQFIVNRFERAELGVKEIADWIQVEDVMTVPCFNKEFINANFIGLPIIIYSKNPHVKSAFQKLEKTIL
ncbi:CpaE family protein [Brevibacillus sp. NPDC058079]|uniref:AAA family ATPase n=1 Tax=Brevibacillus sp. NPDC058079 TaxID=3346330 RepID=UPI0036ECB8F7